jgi:anthranilate synthase component II
MILVIDNYDSFTFNLVQYLGELGAELVVKRNDELTVEDVGTLAPSAIVVSPGPCAPPQAGVSVPLIRRWGPTVPTLGVCLGHQAIGEAFGGRVVRARKVMHGKTSRVRHTAQGIFAGLPDPMQVMRYHSLTVDAKTLPPELEIVARDQEDEAEIHGLKHRQYPVWGVQFHPESIMTPDGKALLRNFLDLAR